MSAVHRKEGMFDSILRPGPFILPVLFLRRLVMLFRPLLPLVVFLVSCSSEPVPADRSTPQRPARQETTPRLSVPAKRAAVRPLHQAAAKTTYALLQGTWQSTDDPKDVIELRGHRRIEYYAGVPLGTTVFMLDRACPSDPKAGHPSDNGRYLVEPREDMCWEIVGVNNQGLELSYVARGNTLNYRRIK